MESAESAFRSEKPAYALTTVIDKLRNEEFDRLDREGHVYLDYTGGSLYAASQVQKHMELLLQGVFGNPHSTNPTSQLSGKLIEETRQYIKDYFNAADYQLVFTANASQALKIIGEGYPFQDAGQFLLLFDNHNSVNGIREYCRGKGAMYAYSPVRLEDLRINEQALEENLDRFADKKNKLFAFPAQSNVSGVKHDLDWIEKAQAKGWDVLLDAAAFVPTNPLDLSVHQPEFVTMSFYKIFGYPTGLGGLFIKNSVFEKLQKAWFAGGTVRMVAVSSDNFFLAENYERFEDGTLNYIGIPALKFGFEKINSIGMPVIQQRVYMLTEWLLDRMLSLKHQTGKSLVQVFGPQDMHSRGGTIIFNLFSSAGDPLNYFEIEQAANAQKISLRTGCFCNPGIDEINHAIGKEELSRYFTSHTITDLNHMSDSLGRMRGAIRVSLGWASNFTDVERFVAFLEGYLQ